MLNYIKREFTLDGLLIEKMIWINCFIWMPLL
ncbi:hypothetical protein uav_048 [Pseudomonas phage UAVern]|uniref:Uncharacterized protein n=1 Tax=Pseudomonas phage UAVern TaxID=2856997 RepID=A0A975UUE7_9CAUD|nr:hypothetical protein uav_048 [Pseudomonas phage UAVern]